MIKKTKSPKKGNTEAGASVATPVSTYGASNFDGANYSRFRSFLYGLQTTAKGGEVTSWARNELNRRAKRLFNDSPAIRFLCTFLQRHVVGPGIFPIAMTKDNAFNVAMERYWDNWAGNRFYCDARGQKTFYQMQRQCITDWFRSGETFVKKSFSYNGFPQFQKFNPLEIGGSEDGKVYDGVILNKYGGVSGFRVQLQDGKFRDEYADSMCHVADLERDDGQLRSPTCLYTGLNAAQDLMEITAAEKVRHKLQSMFTVAIKRDTLNNPTSKSMGGVINKVKGSVTTGTGVDGTTQTETQIERLMEKMQGFGALAYLGTGEELQFLQVQGNDAFQTLQMFLVYELSWSIGINPETAFYLSKLGGTANRAGLEDFAAQISVIQDRINEQLNTPFWVWLAATAQARGDVPRCKDPDWWKVVWQGPPRMSVDLGRMGSMMIDLRNNGMLTLAQYWGGQGMGWRDATEQIAQEIRQEKIACWNASDHEPGEEMKITVDYHEDYRVIAGRTVIPQADNTQQVDNTQSNVDAQQTIQ
jgi:capsid protein